MKKKFNPQYIADCRKQIGKAMKDESQWELRMCDIMTAAATAFGNSSDADVDRMKLFLLELTLSSMENLNKKPEIPYESPEYCKTLFERSSKVLYEVIDQLICVCRRESVFTFPEPVTIVALDRDEWHFHEVKIKTLQWNDISRDILMEDTDGNVWSNDDIPPSFLEKLLGEIIEQDLYPKYHKPDEQQ